MTAIEPVIDYALYLLFALTMALVVYKTLDLWMPSLLGRADFSQQLGPDEASLDLGMEQLEAGLTLLALLAVITPFIGLAGTVIHIMAALRAMGTAGADVSVISGPVVTALNATLVGLASAIPAASAHALMSRRLQVLENRQRRLWARG